MRTRTSRRPIVGIAAGARRALRRLAPAWPTSKYFRWLQYGGLRLLVLLVLVWACAPTGESELVPRQTLFIGIDVSGSFQKDGAYDDAMAFAARYIHGRLNGLGELEEPRALFVGSIGGETPGEPQAFHPIHDFEGKSPEEIEADLREWFAPDDRFTDFNAFFRRAATLVKRQNLVLAPVTLVLLTDGIPDLGALPDGVDESERYAQIDLEPLEYLARNVTIRVLYPDPTVAVAWERQVPRDRVRMWTVDEVVMRGWREQLREPPAPPTLDRPPPGPARREPRLHGSPAYRPGPSISRTSGAGSRTTWTSGSEGRCCRHPPHPTLEHTGPQSAGPKGGGLRVADHCLLVVFPPALQAPILWFSPCRRRPVTGAETDEKSHLPGAGDPGPLPGRPRHGPAAR